MVQLEGNELEQFIDTDSIEIQTFCRIIKYHHKWSLQSVIEYILNTGTKLRFIGQSDKWQLVLLQGMLAALILLFCILILLLAYNTLDDVSPS